MSKSISSVRVLIVDDNADLASSMSQLLAYYGFDVASASSGLRGLETAKRFHPRIVLLDIGLPDIDGYQVASRMRSELSDESLLIVAISAFERDRACFSLTETGFDHYLMKPVEFDHLLPLITNVS
jgi:two-component system CheB/CheR fusion protein